MALSADYDTPEAWAEGADPAYEALSKAIVGASPVPLAGRLVVDLGAGTGATARSICALGGRPMAVDVSLPMLAHRRAMRPPAVVADMETLPLASGRLGGAVSAFSLSHVDNPTAVLSEARRVTEAGGPVLAGVFAETGDRHPAKGVVEELVSQRGWCAPRWYLRMKQDLEPQVADAKRLIGFADAAGLSEIKVIEIDVDAGLNSAEALVRWRLSAPSIAPFVAVLTPDVRASLRAEAVAAIGPDVQPLLLAVRILSSVAPATR